MQQVNDPRLRDQGSLRFNFVKSSKNQQARIDETCKGSMFFDNKNQRSNLMQKLKNMNPCVDSKSKRSIFLQPR